MENSTKEKQVLIETDKILNKLVGNVYLLAEMRFWKE